MRGSKKNSRGVGRLFEFVGGGGGSEAYFLLFNYVNLRNLNIKEFQGGLVRGEVTRL